MPSTALRSQLRVANAAHPVSGFRAVHAGEEVEIHAAELDLEPAISAITERAQHLTGATGAAIALRAGDEIVCRARAGRTAPDLGVRLQTDAGISAEAVRTGEVMLCHDAERNPRVDLASCRRLGVRSILVSPLRYYRRTLGVFEVLSSSPSAFDERDVATMQLLSSMMVAAISRISSLHQSRRAVSRISFLRNADRLVGPVTVRSGLLCDPCKRCGRRRREVPSQSAVRERATQIAVCEVADVEKVKAFAMLKSTVPLVPFAP